METRYIWARMGISLQCTPDEVDALFGENEQSSKEVFDKILSEGRFEYDGESYIPAPIVEEYNAEYGTDYEEKDYEF